MDFKQLESFVAIAKLKSFSRAAEELYLTQPTISNHIHILEKELSTILFNRTNKNITLTDAGEILYEHAISILNKKEHAYFSLNEFKGKIQGILEISSSSIPEQYYLSNIICKFSKKYPDVKYSLLKYDSKKVTDKILSGEIDFGLVGARENSSQINYIDILDDEIVLIAPNNSSFNNISTISIDNFKPYPLIFREEGSGTRKVVISHLEEAGVKISDLNIISEVEDNETIKKLVINGLGLSFISSRAIKNELELGLLKEIHIDSIDFKRSFYFAYHKKRVLSPLSETFKDFIIKEK